MMMCLGASQRIEVTVIPLASLLLLLLLLLSVGPPKTWKRDFKEKRLWGDNNGSKFGNCPTATTTRRLKGMMASPRPIGTLIA